jgi:hypothetical protein
MNQSFNDGNCTNISSDYISERESEPNFNVQLELRRSLRVKRPSIDLICLL